jgi:Zn-dependent protease with chaperone function
LPSQVSLPYSRLHEEEADLIGLDLLVRSRIDPSAAVGVWQKMHALERTLEASARVKRMQGWAQSSFFSGVIFSEPTNGLFFMLCMHQAAKTVPVLRLFETTASNAEHYGRTHPLSADRLTAIQEALPQKLHEFASTPHTLLPLRFELAQSGEPCSNGTVRSFAAV